MRRGMLVLLLAAALGSSIGTSSYSAEELFDTKAAAEHLDKGLAAIRAKQYDSAIKELEESANINPTAETYYYLGYAYYLKGKVTGDGESRKLSRENFDRAYELDPQYSPTGMGLPAPPAAKAPEPVPAPAPEQPAMTDESATPDEGGERVFRGTYEPEPETPSAPQPPQPPAPSAEQPPAQPSDLPPPAPPAPPEPPKTY